MKPITLENNELYRVESVNSDAGIRLNIVIKGDPNAPWPFWIGKMAVAVDEYYSITTALRDRLLQSIRDLRELEASWPDDSGPKPKKPWYRKDCVQGLLFILSVSVALVIMVLAMTACTPVYAETRVTPYVSAGVLHKDCNRSHPTLCTREMGSDTPGLLGAGVVVEGCGWWCLGASQTKVGWFHQSYVDRGAPVNGDPETWMDSYGVEFTWRLNRFSIEF